MFGFIKKREELLKEIDALKTDIDERDRLRDQVRDLKDEIAGLQSKKKIEQEDIRHMVRLKEERMEVTHEKAQLKMESEKELAW